MSLQRPQTAVLALALLQLNVEGLTIAKTNILEQIASKNNVTVILLQTHAENKNILKVPGYTLAGYIANKHHGMATFVRNDMTWSAIGISPERAEVESNHYESARHYHRQHLQPAPKQTEPIIAARCPSPRR